MEQIEMSKEQRNYKNNSQQVFIRTFGCQMNDADSEVMERLLESEGYRKIDSPEGVAVIILKKNN